MIQFNTHRLNNGLRLIHHHDATTSMVAVNLLYDVGSSDEAPTKTGLAHLMEHLMFSGTKHVAKYDEMLQQAGGDSNAWTNIDVTNYYDILPSHNLETALWLESERLVNLNLTEENIEVQKAVVIEEFKQRYLNQPYGDVIHLTHGQAYQVHPYRWPTIGLDVDTIRGFTRADITAFHNRFYSVGNMVICLSGNVNFDTAVRLVEKWFGDIEGEAPHSRQLPAEPAQDAPRFMTHHSDVPNNMIFRTYHMCSRTSDNYQTTDLVSDILGNGMSSRFYQQLILATDIFADVDASVLGSRDPGLFYVRARLADGVDFDKANNAIDDVLKRLVEDGATQHEIDKCVNKFLSNKLFENVGYAEKAVSLCGHELLWGANGINAENDLYRTITPADIARVVERLFDTNNCSTIYYGPDA
jgi:predicted Zn-dependent peptidase